jgi:DNA-binding transcriptional regulator YiaG
MTPQGSEVRATRTRLGYSCRAFAELLGYGADSRIREIETGRRFMSGPAAKLFWLVDADENVVKLLEEMRPASK